MKQTFKTYLSLLRNRDLSAIVKEFKENCSWDVHRPLYHYAFKDTATEPVVAHSFERDNDARKVTREVIQFANKEEWDKFPDRSKSTFFTTSKEVHPLLSKRQLFAAYPFKNQKIAVLNSLDFNSMNIELGGFASRFRHVVGSLRAFSFIMNGKWENLETKASIANVYELLKNTTGAEYSDRLQQTKMDSRYNEFAILPKYFEEFKQQVLTGWSPSSLGITLQNTSNFRFPEKTSEVWMEGKYVLVPIHDLKLFIKQVENANI